MYLSGEIVPGGISVMNAFDVPDIFTRDIKVCIVDSGYDLSHPDLPSSSTQSIITGKAGGFNQYFKDGHGHGKSKR